MRLFFDLGGHEFGEVFWRPALGGNRRGAERFHVPTHRGSIERRTRRGAEPTARGVPFGESKAYRSGLRLEAQRQAVLAHLNGGTPIAEFTEVESGRRSDRPQLAAALAACRLHKATLVIAKLDWLARNVAFVSNLMEAGVDFQAVDFPTANRLTIHILGSVSV
jgi:hypothetical protein